MIKMLRENRLFCKIICHRVFINLGDSLFYIVLMWVLYDLTKDPFYTSIGGFMFSLSDVLNFFCGPMIDRASKGRLLAAASGVQCFVAAVLCLFAANGMLSVSVLVCSIPVFNLMSRMTYSIHNAMVPDVMAEEMLVSANSILSMTGTGIDLLFNAVTGVLLAVLNLRAIFLVNSLIDLAALVTALAVGRALAMKKDRAAKTSGTQSSFRTFLRDYGDDLKKGLMFVRRPVILSLIVPLVGLNLLYAMMMVHLPVFAAEMFGSAAGYGLTLTLFAAGSISGAAVSSRLMKCFAVGKILPVLFLYGGASWVLMACFVEPLPLLGAILIVTASSALGIINIVFGTLFQQLPPKQMIGRVQTVNLSLMAVASLLGSLLGGIIAQASNAIFPFLICGAGYLLIAVTMRADSRVRDLPKMSDISERTLSS